jgi:integrase
MSCGADAGVLRQRPRQPAGLPPRPEIFAQLCRAAGIGAFPGGRNPRVHDLRHSFTVATMLDWYRAGLDVHARLPLLSTYLGHVDPVSTYWYLQAAPELLALAASRLDNHLGDLP